MEDSVFVKNSWREGRIILELGMVIEGFGEMFKILQLIDWVDECVFIKDITCGATLNVHAIQDSSGSYQKNKTIWCI